MIKACIFDLDGVLVDTAKYHYLAWKRLAGELKIEFTEDDNERLKGVSRMDSLDIILSLGGISLSQEEKEKLANRKNNWFVEYINQMKPDEIFQGVSELLQQLKKQSLRVGLASSSKNAPAVLKLLKIENQFDAVVDGSMVSQAKPDPALFLLAASKLNVQPSDCVVFEDAEAGVEAALRAGMKCVGVGSPKQLAKAHMNVSRVADFEISNLKKNIGAMKQYLKHHEWQIIEEGFNPHYNKISESVFSIGNGRMGQRANFEEEYSGETLRGSYVAGVYYPDKTRVGWWKNGYPEYFAKVLNAPNWIGIHIMIENQKLDLAKCAVANFKRTLDMKVGLLTRSFQATLPDGKKVQVEAKRFCSMAQGEIGVIRYAIKPLNFSAKAVFSISVDADVVNKDSNYDEKFWEEVNRYATEGEAIVTAQTKKTNFHVCTGMRYSILEEGKKVSGRINLEERDKYAGNVVLLDFNEGKEIVVYKYAAVLSSENHPKEKLVANCKDVLDQAVKKGFDNLLHDHTGVWSKKWNECDITIDGDIAAQQGIRFNIFQLTQTYTGDDARLNIGPKGFTGEKYGGSTYWDTEAYCLPFFLSTAEQNVARNLLIYRHKQLPKAIENAEKLGFKNGAALYPMVTMNGEECHNEWEITFEEIHRNGAIAYAIYDYVRYTGDAEYLSTHGLEVLIGISRFWAQRVNWSTEQKKYVMLGVTGPNEYENNVNNNWYTNYLAVWTLKYTLACIEQVKGKNPTQYQSLVGKIKFDATVEETKWNHIVGSMHFPEDKVRGVFLQQDGFLDKELLTVNDLRPEDRPINQKWSWDRILRSCFIKQADVLQGLYFFEEHFDRDTIKRNFDFYEPMTVHESSLSPCVHVILASKLGYEEKAYEMYLRTSRLDLDDYNNDTEDGCHITSMAGTWMSVVKGFGGMQVLNDKLHLHPFIPKQWKSYSFRIEFRDRVIKLKVCKDKTETSLESGEPIEIMLAGEPVWLEGVKVSV